MQTVDILADTKIISVYEKRTLGAACPQQVSNVRNLIVPTPIFFISSPLAPPHTAHKLSSHPSAGCHCRPVTAAFPIAILPFDAFGTDYIPTCQFSFPFSDFYLLNLLFYGKEQTMFGLRSGGIDSNYHGPLFYWLFLVVN